MTNKVPTIVSVIAIVYNLLLPTICHIQGRVNEVYIEEIDYLRQLEFAYEATADKNPFRLEVSSINAVRVYPVLVVVRQEKSVTSWQLPLLVESKLPSVIDGLISYRTSARTLCNPPGDTVVHSAFQSHPKLKANFTLSLSTFSKKKVRVQIRAIQVANYTLQTDVEYRTRVTPSEPVYFVYNFPDNNIKTVMLKVNSKDNVCFTVSVQPNICPIYDLNDHVMYQGKYQSVNKKGGLVIHRNLFGRSLPGFVVVFVAKADNYECDVRGDLISELEERSMSNGLQEADVTFRIKTAKKSGEYLIAILSLFGFNLLLCILIIILTLLFYRFGSYYNILDYDVPKPFQAVDDDVVDAIQESMEPKLIDFIYHGQRNHRKALNYFWHIANIAIFYGLPVIQLMIFYQRAVNISGDLDLCYYNSQCSHPLYFSDFNHVYSNLGYVMFGVLFLIITGFRNVKVKNLRECGIPKLYGLYYAMGIALTFEGVLSACYHICPNQSNFQFDTSFMYVMAILIMVKLHQNRHPDVHPSAYSTFTILGGSVVVAMFGILYNSLIVFIVFFISYILLCMYMVFKLYFFTNIVKRVKRLYGQQEYSSWMEVLKPKRTKLLVFLMIGFFINLAMAISGFFLYPKPLDFGTYLLIILMGNALMHGIFYTTMKLSTEGEHICFEAILYGSISLVLWFSGSYFFFNAATTWGEPPAKSRQLNKDCLLLDFYDTHDIWHILSAPALFFSFLFLMALDDDLFDKPQTEIKVF